MIEKQGIINLCSESYISEVLGDSEVIFLREEDSTFCPFLYCDFVIHSIA